MQSVFVAGVNENENQVYTVYPNPANDKLFVSGELNASDTYLLTSMDGKQISQGKLTGTIEVGMLSPGLYLLLVKSATGLKTFRIVVQ